MSSSSKAFRNEICRRFVFYMMRGSMSVGQAFEATLSDINSLQDTYFAEEVLIEQCVTLFASKYESLLYEGTHEPDPDNVFPYSHPSRACLPI